MRVLGVQSARALNRIVIAAEHALRTENPTYTEFARALSSEALDEILASPHT